MISIVTESPAHRDSIRYITETAFTASELGHNGEADLIEAVRAASDQTVSLVAIQDSEVVGHILFTPVEIRFPSQTLHGMGIGPMSVLPAFQRNGIGSRLVTAGLRRLSSMDFSFTVVAGHPDFYSRFGFVPSADYGITHGFAGMPQNVFIILVNNPASMHVRGGLAYYRPEFGPQHNRFE
jgi:putative acetyltransferase